MYLIKMNCIFLLFYFIDIFADNYALGNFCNIFDCGAKHVACNYTQGSKGPACPGKVSNYIVTVFKEELILKLHNDERNYVAKGRAIGLKPAARMAAMSWDEQLYIFATIKAVMCTLEPDPCHPTDVFRYSGQNLGHFDYPGEYGNVSVETAVTNIITKWLSADQNTTQAMVDKFPENLQNTSIDSYALIINERNTHIGCGIAWIQLADKQNRILLVCNYATRNFVGSKIYTTGETASKCNTGLRKFNGLFGLCSLKEKYNYGPK